MRFMMLMIPKGYESAPPDAGPDAALVAAMLRYNDSLQKAGVLLAQDGLVPPAAGTRVAFEGGRPRVVDGPFAETKEAVGGYWMIQAKSQAEAVEWATRCPAPVGSVIEVRRIKELADFPADVQRVLAGAS